MLYNLTFTKEEVTEKSITVGQFVESIFPTNKNLKEVYIKMSN